MTGTDDLEQLFRSLSRRHYEIAADERFGAQGTEALVRLVGTTRELLKHVAYEMLTDGLQVVVAVDPERPPQADGGAALRNLADLAGRAFSGLTVAILGTASHRVWDSEAVRFNSDGPLLVYSYIHGQSETITIDGTEWRVNDSPWDCGMATPTFSTLEGALEKYVTVHRVPEQCAHLDKVWRDDKRLAFVEKPEKHMRRSLLLALTYSLSEATVRPELNQSETKPVDIEVSWWGIKRSAIIEIKWLGDSGPEAPATFTTSYSQSRAVSGLKQLADYLDLRDATTSDVPVLGYLFVFDGRRRGLSPDQTTIGRSDGLYYSMRDPDYPPEVTGRPDMGPPFRCFLRAHLRLGSALV